MLTVPLVTAKPTFELEAIVMLVPVKLPPITLNIPLLYIRGLLTLSNLITTPGFIVSVVPVLTVTPTPYIK